MDSTGPQCAEGIILHMIPYRNYDQIVTVFTKDRGILKLFCKKGKTQSHRYTPLTKVEFVYIEKQSELCQCEEISPVQSYLYLRNHLIHLEAGCRLIHAIHQSQWVGREAPLLYDLLTYYLDKIPELNDPFILVASFRLKILSHDGLLNLNPSGQYPPEFDEEEIIQLQILAYGQSYKELAQQVLSEETKAKIEAFFFSKLKE
jgi:DNA repair protein RecO